MEHELVKALEGTSDLSSNGGGPPQLLKVFAESKGAANYLSMLETLHFKHRHGLGHLDGPNEDHTGSTIAKAFEISPEIAWRTSSAISTLYTIRAMKESGDLAMHTCAHNEWTFDLEEAFRKRDYSSATIFGLSLYIDIRYILETRVTEAFDLAQATAAKTKTTLKDHLPDCIEDLDKVRCLHRIAEVNNFILHDFLEKEKARMLKEHDYKEKFEKHQLLKRNPIWSRFLDFRCRLVLNDLGLRFINQSPIALGAVFAYAAFLTGETRG
ncbi:hypothetical protein Hte_004307 [Hypoxylon texense]